MIKVETIVIANLRLFMFVKCVKPALKHKNVLSVNNLTELQGFFNKTVARFSFINIFAFC